MYGIAWYCIPTGAQFPFPGAQASKGQPGHGRLSLSLQICALCCTSNGVYVHRAISCVSTKLQTPNPNCAWSSIIVGCGFYHVLCDPRTYRYTVHLLGSAVSWILVSFASSPSTALSPWEQPGRGSARPNLNAFCPFLQERRVRAKSWIF